MAFAKERLLEILKIYWMNGGSVKVQRNPEDKLWKSTTTLRREIRLLTTSLSEAFQRNEWKKFVYMMPNYMKFMPH
jgi:hypothetical protein